MRSRFWARLPAPICLVVALTATMAAGARAQEEAPPPDSAALVTAATPPDSAQADSTVGVSPAGAFLRGSLLPGWGHATSGAFTRGAFYFSMEALSGWMVFKTQRRLQFAREEAALWEEIAAAEAAAQGVTDPVEVEAFVGRHDEAARYRGLVAARSEQREDWVAVALFTLLLSGVDAYVSAHLKEFPEPLTVEGDPTGGTVEVSVRVPLVLPFP